MPVQYGSEISRRDFLKYSVGSFALPFLSGCSKRVLESFFRPRLSARPGTPSTLVEPGVYQLGLGGQRDGILYVPDGYDAENAAPLFVVLHGAGGTSTDWASYYVRADARGMVLLIPDSRASTWDMILGGFGPDVEFLDQALTYTFERCLIDPMRLALGGFSDGATYALSLGLSNGDLFSHLIGYSPGFIQPSDPIVGKPTVYVSHGTRDNVLPVTQSRDIIVPYLRNAGYDVTYEEFDGGHQVPAAISESALDWFLDGDGL